MVHRVWIGIGSNLGRRESYIRYALSGLARFLTGMSVSGVYETAPRDFADQPDFLNAVACGDTDLEPWELWRRLSEIEHSEGRRREDETPKGPRTLDLDLLLFGSSVLSLTDCMGQTLIVPHPSMHQRLFVLAPLTELDPEATDPRDGVRWAEKASHLCEQRVKLYQR